MKANDVLPIKALCSEYAQGRITFEQFEHRIDQLVAERAATVSAAPKKAGLAKQR